uniref:Uncharacterized protein n=1 Tax=Panagrellus redivivus TaxID=6233 RepID=A0A7E4UR22_PANRE
MKRSSPMPSRKRTYLTANPEASRSRRVMPPSKNCPSSPKPRVPSANTASSGSTRRQDLHHQHLVWEDSQPEQTSAAVTVRQGIYEKTDFCEQQNLGILGTHSRRCRPGGYGCFHLVPEGKEKSEAIASCVGKAEELIAVDDGAHERYREAAICLTEKARDQCLRGARSCCKETTEMMLNANEFPLMKIGDFKDAKDDDDEDE